MTDVGNRFSIVSFDSCQGKQGDKPAIAFCDTPERAQEVFKAVNAHDSLVAALEAITMIAGNLPDETLESCGGINEGRGRALMALNARSIAREALKLAQ